MLRFILLSLLIVNTAITIFFLLTELFFSFKDALLSIVAYWLNGCGIIVCAALASACYIFLNKQNEFRKALWLLPLLNIPSGILLYFLAGNKTELAVSYCAVGTILSLLFLPLVKKGIKN